MFVLMQRNYQMDGVFLSSYQSEAQERYLYPHFERDGGIVLRLALKVEVIAWTSALLLINQVRMYSYTECIKFLLKTV